MNEPMKTVIITDSGSDLPVEYMENNKISFISMMYNFSGREYEDDFGKTMSHKEFYDGLRSGLMSSTSQINTFKYVEEFKKHVSQGKSIIYIGLSSGLSGSINNANLAVQMVREEYKNADISIVDSKGASMGEGLMVYYACEMLKKGASKEEIVNWLEENKFKICHWFTVEDLNHLKRGGRVSGTAAFIGTILDIKPVLYVNDEGKLIPVAKVKGRKKSLRMLADKFKELVVNPEEQTIMISHGDCLEDAKHLEKIILEEFKVKEVIINPIGPVIGSHSGPGTVALFFMGEKR